MDSDEEDEKKVTKGPKFPIQMYISEGNKYLRLAKYDVAIGFFNTALEKEPTNEKSLIGRSKCLMRQAKFNEAKEDAKAILKAHPNSPEAKMLIGEADYFLGDFERAFLTFHRGHEARLNHEGLKRGHQMSTKAIANSLQPDIQMTLNDDDINNIFELTHYLERKQPLECKIARDQFTPDVDFVTTLLNDDSMESIHSDCEYLRDYLKDRQVFWRTQKPNTSERNTISPASIDEGKEIERDGDLNESFIADDETFDTDSSNETITSTEHDDATNSQNETPDTDSSNEAITSTKHENAANSQNGGIH